MGKEENNIPDLCPIKYYCRILSKMKDADGKIILGASNNSQFNDAIENLPQAITANGTKLSKCFRSNNGSCSMDALTRYKRPKNSAA